MRPVPKRRHHWAVVIFLGTVAANTALTFYHPTFTGAQANLLAEVYQRQDPTLYASDAVFSPRDIPPARQLHSPAWQYLMGSLVGLVGRDDPLQALRLLGAAALLLYLLSMYVLLYRQTHSWSVAALVAVLSTAFFSVRRPYWGLGPLLSVEPATLFLALVPVLVVAFLRTVRGGRVLVVFLVAGLAGNIDLFSAVGLVAVLALVTAALGRFRPAALGLSGAALAVAAIGASPALLHYWQVSAARGAVADASWQSVQTALAWAGVSLLYPTVLLEVLRWLPMALVLAVPAALILGRGGRYTVRDARAWVYLLAAALTVALGFHGLAQLAWRWSGHGRPMLEFFGALRLAMLPLYVLFCHAMVYLLRLSRSHKYVLRLALAAFAVIYLAGSFNTHPLRRMLADAAAAVAPPRRPSAYQVVYDQAAELEALALWARQDSARDSLFITPRAELRLYGRRSILACDDDLPYLYRLRQTGLEDWTEILAAQQAVLRPARSNRGNRADPAEALAFARGAAGNLRSPPAEVYILFETDSAPEATDDLQEVPSPLWGRHWKLYRIGPPPAPPTATATDATDAETPPEPAQYLRKGIV